MAIGRQVIKLGEMDVEAHYGGANEYRAGLQLISKVGLDARILDLGGGQRHLNLAGFVNLDMREDPRWTDVVGDVHYLPFRDNTFDLILADNVFEHIRKPWLVVEEIYRVLKCKGFIYVDTAFMAPFHPYPHHYFNMTREGLEVLFDKFAKLDSGVQKYQMPSYTVTLVLSQYVRCFLPSIDKRAKRAERYDRNTKRSILDSVLATILDVFLKFLQYFDRFIKPEKAQDIAVGVYFVGMKE